MLCTLSSCHYTSLQRKKQRHAGWQWGERREFGSPTRSMSTQQILRQMPATHVTAASHGHMTQNHTEQSVLSGHSSAWLALITWHQFRPITCSHIVWPDSSRSHSSCCTRYPWSHDHSTPQDCPQAPAHGFTRLGLVTCEGSAWLTMVTWQYCSGQPTSPCDPGGEQTRRIITC